MCGYFTPKILVNPNPGALKVRETQLKTHWTFSVTLRSIDAPG